MGNHGPDVLADLRGPARELRRLIPEVYDGFSKLHGSAMAGGVLDAKTKELIALAISVSTQCDGCIASHARGAHKQGATPEEVAEAIGVTLMMSGGPATVYGPRAMAAYQAFASPEQ
jgi:AhpD family alkylhydroperoxidase